MEDMTINNTAVETTNETETVEAVKTYTQDEVLALLQSETDKRVSQALKVERYTIFGGSFNYYI